MSRATTFRLGPGTELTDGTRRFRITNFVRDAASGVQAVIDVDGSSERIAFSDLCLHSPRLASASPTELLEPCDAEWRALPEDVRRRVIDLARHLTQIDTGSPDGNFERAVLLGRVDPRYDPRTTTLSERVRAKSIELTALGRRGASVRTLRRQIEGFRRHGHIALADGRWGKRRNPLDRADPEAVGVLRELMVSRLPGAGISQRNLLNLARVQLRSAGHVDFAAHRSLGAVVGELTRGLAFQRPSRSRDTHTNRPDGPYGRLIVTRPGEVVQIDATPSNVHCWFPDEGWMRATILTAIDCYTRQILALRVVPGAISARDSCLLLWDVTQPQVPRLGAPFELARWHGVPSRVVIDVDQTRLPNEPAIGTKPSHLPSVVVIDHGAEFDSVAFQSACMRNEIDVIFARPGQATDKAIVESWHKTLDHALMVLPGYKGANPQNHPRDAERDAALTCADLHDMLWTWILTVYHERAHDGLRSRSNPAILMSPNMTFDLFIERGGYLEVPHDPFRRLAFLPCDTRLLQDHGIRVLNHVYNSAELIALRPLVQRGVGVKAIELTVYYDPWDMTRIYVRHPRDQSWVCVPLAHPTHQVIAPFSDIITRAAIESTIDGSRAPLAGDELLHRELAVIAAWNAGNFAGTKQQRQHAAERARQQLLAGEVDNWPDELRSLAFFDRAEQQEQLGIDLSDAEEDDAEIFDEETDDDDGDSDDDDGLAL